MNQKSIEYLQGQASMSNALERAWEQDGNGLYPDWIYKAIKAKLACELLIKASETIDSEVGNKLLGEALILAKKVIK